MRSQPLDHGFTLIELSVVLVTIGLLIGGMMIGRELLAVATLRRVIAEKEHLEIAVRSFKSKFGQWPGDHSRVYAMWGAGCVAAGNGLGASDANCSGDGNGLISSTSATVREEVLVFRHLNMAGLLGGNYQGRIHPVGDASGDAFVYAPNMTNPPTAFTSKAGWRAFFYVDAGGFGRNALYLNGHLFAGGDVWGDYGIMTGKDAWNIDSKVDDGRPGRGKMLSYGKGDHRDGVWGGCHNGDNLETEAKKQSAVYTLNSSRESCVLFFQFD